MLFDEIRTLIEENSREELRDELAAITEEIGAWQETYAVETWEALEQSLADGDLSSADLRERRDVIAFWRGMRRTAVRHGTALSGYSGFKVEGDSPSTTRMDGERLFPSKNTPCSSIHEKLFPIRGIHLSLW